MGLKVSVSDKPKCLVRFARSEDLDSVVALAHKCFPASLRFNPNLRYTRQWWRTSIEDSSAAVFIAEVAKTPVGFTLMLLDEARWKRLIAGYRIVGGLNLDWLRLVPIGAGILYRRAWFPRSFGARMPKVVFSDLKPAGKRIFVEMTGVSPEYQRLGIGWSLGRAVERYAQAAGFPCVCRRVNRNNLANINLLLKAGYTAYANDGKQYSFFKRLL